ncbi:hypothetical protein [Umezawaea sp. NPDC059074]|uniref:hypothetical protein n=1 Tax=Umezawaea sp. NPDC059074 TaxID=3346716 RepID=UPI0036CE1C2D
MIQDAVNDWLGEVFAPANVDRTVAKVVASQPGAAVARNGRETAKQRLAAAEAHMNRFQEAIKAGIDPAALVEAMNEAQAARAAARAELEGTPAPNTVSDAEIYAAIDSLGDVGTVLKEAKTETLAALYQSVDLQVLYTHTAHEADVIIKPVSRVNNAHDREGISDTQVRDRSRVVSNTVRHKPRPFQTISDTGWIPYPIGLNQHGQPITDEPRTAKHDPRIKPRTAGNEFSAKSEYRFSGRDIANPSAFRSSPEKPRHDPMRRPLFVRNLPVVRG